MRRCKFDLGIRRDSSREIDEAVGAWIYPNFEAGQDRAIYDEYVARAFMRYRYRRFLFYDVSPLHV